MAVIESNHLLLRDVLLKLARANEIAEAQLKIAQEYKQWIGDPVRHGVWFLRMARNVIAILVGAVLGGWALKEIFESYFVPRIKP